MTRTHEDSDAGREARRLTDGLWNRGFIVHSVDNQRGANEGLGEREIKALAEENGRPWGRSIAPMVIAEGARQAGHDAAASSRAPAASDMPGPGSPRNEKGSSHHARHQSPRAALRRLRRHRAACAGSDREPADGHGDDGLPAVPGVPVTAAPARFQHARPRSPPSGGKPRSQP